MKIKKFRSASFKEALEEVKRELGPDAVILSSKRLRGVESLMGRSSDVEVTAAIEEDAGEQPLIAKPQGNHHLPDMSSIMGEIRSLKHEIVYLKETIQPIIPVVGVKESKKELFNILVRNGVDMHSSISLLQKCHDSLKDLKSMIRSSFTIEPPLSSEEKGVVFLGPPGVGKTSSMMKIAHKLREKGKEVNLISLDSNRAGSIAAVHALAKGLGCRLSILNEVEELPGMFEREREGQISLVDTPGNQCKTILDDLRNLSCDLPLRNCFLMDVSMSTGSTMKIWDSYDSSDVVETIGFTKLDLASNYGNLFNLSVATGKPLSFLTTGINIPGDIRLPSPEYLVNLITGGN